MYIYIYLDFLKIYNIFKIRYFNMIFIRYLYDIFIRYFRIILHLTVHTHKIRILIISSYVSRVLRFCLELIY